MKPLERPDLTFLEIAEGLLDLGSGLRGNQNLPDASMELDKISPAGQKHPDTLFLRWKIFDTLKFCDPKMVDICLNIGMQMRANAPEDIRGHLISAQGYEDLNQFVEAYDTLAPLLRTTTAWEIPYRMARYACRLGRPDAARLIKNAIRKGKVVGADIRTRALSNPDLKPLWALIAGRKSSTG